MEGCRFLKRAFLGVWMIAIPIFGILLLPTVAAQAEDLTGLFLLGPLCMLAFILPIIISVAIGIWVYKDANKRGMSGVMWLLIVMVAGLVGLIIYFLVRNDHPQPPLGAPPAYYPQQGYPQQAYAQPVAQQPVYKCTQCGLVLVWDNSAGKWHCPRCNRHF